jgi:hypothetical protein
LTHLIGQCEPRTRSPRRSTTATEATPAPAPANATPVLTSSNGERREDDTPDRVDGSHTNFPLPPSLPAETPNLTHQPFTYHSPHPLLQDPDSQAVFARAITQLAILMNGGRPTPQMGHIGGIPGMTGSMPAMNGFTGSPGWGPLSAWPPSTPTTSGYPYGHVLQQCSFQNPYVTQHQVGSGPGPSFPPLHTFPSSISQPKSTPVVQDTGASQEKTTVKARSRSKSRRRVTFASDQVFVSADGLNDPPEMSRREAESSPLVRRGRSRTRSTKGTPKSQTNRKGKSKVEEVDQGSDLDVVN